MHYSLDVDIEHQFVRLTQLAPMTAEEVAEVWDRLATDERGLAAFDTLIDLRSVPVALTADDVRRLADAARQQPASRRAIVTTNDSDFGLMRMLELMSAAGPRRYAVFRTVEEACAWLDNPGCGRPEAH